MSVRGVRPFSPRARALPMLLSETEILAVGTRSTAGTVLVTASTLACRREVLPTKARFDGPGGYGEHVQVLNQAEVRIRGPGRRQQSGRKGKKSYRYSTRGMKKRFSLPDSERL